MGKFINAAVAVEFLRLHGSIPREDLPNEIANDTHLTRGEAYEGIQLALSRRCIKNADGENARINYHLTFKGEQLIRRWGKVRRGAYLAWAENNKIAVSIVFSVLGLIVTATIALLT